MSSQNNKRDKGTKGRIFGTENIPLRRRTYDNVDELVNYTVVTEDIADTADVCIIGSGAAGAILACKLVEGGLDVVLIEKGGYYDPEDFNQREIDMMKVLWKNGGMQFDENLSVLVAQGECLGGSTMINDAVCFDTPDSILKEWKDDYGIDYGQNWNKAIEEVRDAISVEKISQEEWEHNKNGQQLEKITKNVGYKGCRNERNCKNCAMCGTCHLGCHYETKQDMLNTYIQRALHFKEKQEKRKGSKNGIRIYCNCDVRKIDYNKFDGSYLATGIEGKFLGSIGLEKFKIKVNAKLIIIAAGAISSSALLLDNNIALGKAGKHIALQPAATVIAKYEKYIGASNGITMAYSCYHFSPINKKNLKQSNDPEFMLESIFTPKTQFSCLLPWSGEPDKGVENQMDLMKYYDNYAMTGVVIRDEPNSSIELSETGYPKISFILGDKEIKNLCAGIKIISRLYLGLNPNPDEKLPDGYKEPEDSEKAKELYIKLGNNQGKIKDEKGIDELIKNINTEFQGNKNNGIHTISGLGSAHPQGGNRMGDKPEDCVVDPDCLVYGFKNLFVCDASVFPTPIGVNTQITVMALATVTAENILEKWKKKEFESFQVNEPANGFCSIEHPETCGFDTLSIMFNKISNTGNVDDLVNSENCVVKKDCWDFDPKSLMITNNCHWRGFIPDPDFPIPQLQPMIQDSILDWWDDYLEGFWKKFQLVDDKIQGKINIYSMENNDLPFMPKIKDLTIVPERIQHEIYGDVIKLRYPNYPFYDLIKFVNKDHIIGKGFLTITPLYPDLELGPFVMTKEYSVEWMDIDDHEKIFKNFGTPIGIEDVGGYWAFRIDMKHLLSQVIAVFLFKDNNDPSKRDKNDPNKIINKNEEKLKQAVLEGIGWSHRKEEIEKWKNQTVKVNENFMIGKLVSDSKEEIKYTLATVAGSWVREQD